MRLSKLILLVLITVLFSQEQIQVGNLIMEMFPRSRTRSKPAPSNTGMFDQPVSVPGIPLAAAC